jgi:hypothetical protein
VLERTPLLVPVCRCSELLMSRNAHDITRRSQLLIFILTFTREAAGYDISLITQRESGFAKSLRARDFRGRDFGFGMSMLPLLVFGACRSTEQSAGVALLYPLQCLRHALYID